MKITESSLEQTTIEWFESLGYPILNGPGIAPEMPGADYNQTNVRKALSAGLKHRIIGWLG